jgi:hypothetical protein
MNVATPVASNEKKAFILHAEEGQRINAFGNEGIFKLTGENTGGTFTLMLGLCLRAAVPLPTSITSTTSFSS